MIVPKSAAIPGRMHEDLEIRVRRALFGALALGAGAVLCLAGIYDWWYYVGHDRRAPLEDTLACLGTAALLLLLATAVRSSRPSRRDLGAATGWMVSGFAVTFAIFAAMMFLGGMFL